MKITNMTSNRGTTVPNQFIITDGNKKIFQSYDSIIATNEGGTIKLDEEYWNYSRTTGKYRNQFLNEGIKETRAKIASGEYILTNLN